ncbi:MAG: oligosaccharide flippase family protein [Promethearchaeota archaeon]
MVKTIKNTTLVLIGTIFLIGIVLVRKALIFKYFSPTEFGFYSIVLGFLELLPSISLLGMTGMVPREIGYYRGTGNFKKIKEIMSTSIAQMIIVTTIATAVVFAFSNSFLVLLQHDLEFLIEFRIFLLSIPLIALINLFISIYRGFDEPKVKVFFEDILRNLLFFLSIVIVIVAGLSLFETSILFVLSCMIPIIIMIIYTKRFKEPKKLHFNIKLVKTRVLKDLLKISIPFFIAEFFLYLLKWIDVFLIGYFTTPENVATYNVAKSITKYIPLVSQAFSFILMPMFSNAIASQNKQTLERLYKIFAKWVIITTFPIFFIIFAFPTEVILFFSKSSYLPSIPYIQILSLSFLLQTVFVISEVGIIAYGDTKKLIPPYVAGLIVDIMLNIILIPRIQLYGAAIAHLICFLIKNILTYYMFLRISKTHPFSRPFFKSLVLIVALSLYSFVFNISTSSTSFLAIVNGVFVMLLYVAGLIALGCFENEDLKLLEMIDKKIGLNLSFIRKIIITFIKSSEKGLSNMHESIECKLCKSSNISTVKNVKSPYTSKHYTLYECKNCHTRFFRLEQHDVDLKEIYEKIASERKEDVKKVKNQLYWQSQKRILEKLLGKKPEIVLDVGCRTGDFLMQFGKDVIREGVELSEISAKIARKRGIHVYQDYLENIEFDKKYDIVTAYAIIEHLSDPVRFLEKLESIIKEHGVLAIMIPSFESLRRQIDDLLDLPWLYQPPAHLFFYSRSFLDSFLEKKGFRLVKRINASGGDFNPFKSIKFVGRAFSIFMFFVDKMPLNKFPVFDILYSYYVKESK